MSEICLNALCQFADQINSYRRLDIGAHKLDVAETAKLYCIYVALIYRELLKTFIETIDRKNNFMSDGF